jgi:integrase
MRFTDAYFRSLKPRTTPYRVFEKGSDAGFCVQVNTSGRIVFQWQHHVDGQRKFTALGHYPDVSLAEARGRLRVERKKSEVPAGKGTAKDLIGVYIAHLENAGRRSATEVQRNLEKHALPYFGKKLASEITPEDIRLILYGLIREGHAVQANRVRTMLHAMFQAGRHHDNDPKSLGTPMRFGIGANPVEAVPKDASVERALDRALTWDELALLWEGKGMAPMYRAIFRMILTTGGQRPGEITGARWEEIEGTNWVIPGSRTKNGRDHTIPITSALQEVLDGQKGQSEEWIFPGQKEGPISRELPSRVARQFCADTGMDVWTPRDLRRTVKTRMGELGISKFTRDVLQNHSRDDVSSRHYDRYSYSSEKRAALEAWCAILC